MTMNKTSVVSRLSIPIEVVVDELGLKGPQILGMDLAAHERKDRMREVLALAHRCLICESTELTAGYARRKIAEPKGLELAWAPLYHGVEHAAEIGFTPREAVECKTNTQMKNKFDRYWGGFTSWVKS